MSGINTTGTQRPAMPGPRTGGAGFDLPPQLDRLNEGQPAAFQQQTRSYLDSLVKNGEIDLKTVTPDEFLAKVQALAGQDPAAETWLRSAGQQVDATSTDLARIALVKSAQHDLETFQDSLRKEQALAQSKSRHGAIAQDELLAFNRRANFY